MTENLHRQKRQRKTHNTWRKWRNRVKTTQVPSTQETMTINLPNWVSPNTIERPHWNPYRTTPEPIHIPTYTSRYTPRYTLRYTPRPRTTKSTNLIETTEETITQSLYKPWDPVSVSSTTQKTTSPDSMTQEQTTSVVHNKTVRIQPGTIVMMNSEYLKEKYIKTGLASTFHRALLADYFGLSEKEMKRIGMTVVAWGFSYQVKDKATSSWGPNRAQRYFCDFKFRSSTFNAGYVGAHINMGIAKLDG